MRLAIGIHSLAGQGGTESWVTTIGDHLQRVGHDVWVYSAEDGVTGELARQLGLRTVFEVRDLPGELDAMLPQDVVSALELAAGHGGVPQVFVSHSDIFDVQLAPQLPDVTKGVITLYDRAQERIESSAVVPPVKRIAQPVDVQRFFPTRPISAKPRTAISLGNYLAGERLGILRQACERAGIEFRQIGATADGATTTPEQAINEADIVFGKAKVVLEAMACGRAVYIYDVAGREGWVTADTYPLLVGDNMAGRTAPLPISAEAIAEDLRGYDPDMGLINRDLAASHHSAVRHTAQLVEAIHGFVGQGRSAGHEARPELFELARMARVNWRHESDAFAQRRHIHEYEVLARELKDRLARAEAELAATNELLAQTHASRRWQATQRVMRPLDRLRGRR